jgi:flagellar motor switch/type III secretory pathway protein FliN
LGQPIAIISGMNQAAVEPSTTPGTSGNEPNTPLPPHWNAFQLLSCQLTMEIAVPDFSIGALLRLAANDVINTRWLQGSDVPLRVNGKLIGWAEFEVTDDHLAARLTQIA